MSLVEISRHCVNVFFRAYHIMLDLMIRSTFFSYINIIVTVEVLKYC